MPGFDRTGPEGQGSGTGWGLGKCNPKSSSSGDQVDLEQSPGGRRSIKKRFGRGTGQGKSRVMRHGRI